MECASAPRKTYSVRVENIPEHERLIFKLIFSVSHKTRGRAHAYVLHDQQDGQLPDLVLSGEPQSLPADSANVRCVAIVDRGDSHPSLACIQRPLIATRVLGALDQLIVSVPDEDGTVADETAVTVAADAEPDTTSVPAPEASFVISDEEASELAFVDDEALSNPANSQTEAPGALPSSPDSFPDEAPVAAASSEEPARSVGAVTVPEVGNIAPKSAPVQSPLLSHAAKPGETTPRMRRRRVSRALVVDDSASVRKQIELELNFFSADVDYAGSATEAVRLLDQNYYDVAFLDVVLPDSDGFQICKRIKATTRSTNVIMLTGKSTQADRVKGALAGCDAYLVKPVGRATFQGTVKDYLEPAPSALVTGT